MKNNYKGWSFDKFEETYRPLIINTRKDNIEPGLYEIERDIAGYYFQKLDFNEQNLLNFPNSNCQAVLDDIKKFWGMKDRFKQFKFPYKRGMLLYGPGGCGKSCTIALLCKEVINLGGIVIDFSRLDNFEAGMRSLREIHPDLPVVVLMEDLDHILEHNVPDILNLLDGVGCTFENIVYLATTNNPERLHMNVKNRPSRFDRKFEFGPPNAKCRRIYIQSLFEGDSAQDYNLDEWVESSEGFSFAHCKELFISVVLFENNFDDAVNELQNMKDEYLEDIEPYDDDDDDDDDDEDEDVATTMEVKL